MLRHRILVVSSEANMRRALKRLMTATGAVTAFDRHVDEDLIPIFSRRRFRKFPQATMTDSDSASAWTPDARAIDGPLKGKKLHRLDVEDGVYWRIAQFWFKNPPLLNPVPEK